MPRRTTRAVNHEAAADSETSVKRPPTSADVARLAQVSQATVSLVLNDVGNRHSSRFSDETRDRVLNAAEALSYVPHALASSLRSGQSNLVLITFLAIPTGLLLALFYEQVAAKLNALGYTVLFHVDRSSRGVEAARSWASLRPVGVICEGERLDDDAVALMRKAGVKAVVAMGVARPLSASSVELPKEETIGRLAAEHLMNTGRTRLGVVVPRDPEIAAIGLDRLRGIEEAALEREIPVQRVDLELNEEHAARVVAEWKRGPRPDGVFAFNDMYAGLLLGALRDAGLRVPDDIALIGCDDLFMSQFLRPRLTTIHLPTELGAHWLAALVDATVHGRSPKLEWSGDWEPYVVVRDSA